MVQWLPVKQQVLDHFIINNVLMSLAVVIVVLRLVSRKLRHNNFGADDYSVMVAMVSIWTAISDLGEPI